MPPIAARRTRLALALALALPVLAGAQPAPASRSAGNVLLLVKFRAAVHGRSARAIVQGSGARQVRSIPQLRVRVLSVPAVRADRVLRALRRTAGVAYAERDGRVRIASTLPNDPWWPNQGSLPHVNAPQAWDLTRGSPQVVIAVLDTGVDSTQPDLQGSFVPGYDFVNNDANPSDDQGHGTQAAGVAAARSNNAAGVASYCWSCSIMPVKVMDATGSGSMATVAAGITWATDHGARVISMSLAGSAGYSTLQSAVQYAHDKGVVLVAAARELRQHVADVPGGLPSGAQRGRQ